MICIPTICSILGASEDNVLALIQNGALSYAFNVGCGRRRRLLRVTTRCVHDYLEGKRSPDDLSEVIASAIPAGQAVRVSQLARAWSISPTQAHNLCGRGLEVVRRQLKRTETPLVTRESVVNFLRVRRFLG